MNLQARSIVVFALILLIMQSCALWQKSPAVEIEHHEQIARDFVHALAQIDTFQPQNSTARFARQFNSESAISPFLNAMKDRMVEMGYAVQLVDYTTPDLVVQHRVIPKGANEFGEVMLHEILVGDIGLRRAYATSESGVLQATSRLFVKGYDASRISTESIDQALPSESEIPPTIKQPAIVSLNEELAALSSPEQNTESNLSSTADGAGVGTLSEENRSPPSPVFSSNNVFATAPAPNRGSLGIEIDPKTGRPSVTSIAIESVLNDSNNIWDLGESNYTSLFTEYGNVAEKVLIFPNDSMRLGDTNKVFIKTFMRDFDPASDVVSIVGCSLGHTDIDNGNEILAKGRAERVKQELLFSGISEAQIFDEGCWADDAQINFPSRGVVMTIKRRS